MSTFKEKSQLILHFYPAPWGLRKKRAVRHIRSGFGHGVIRHHVISTVKVMFVALVAASNAGCAIKPVRETAVISDSRTVLVVARGIERLANQCWRRKSTLLGDGVHIDARLTLDGTAAISAARYAPDIGLRPPFFVATVFREEVVTRIRLQEGDFACRLTGSCFSLDYTSEVQQWLSGQQVCVNRD